MTIMAKSKTSKGGNPTVPQRHLHSRLSYLHQAANFLATTERHVPSGSANSSGPSSVKIVDGARDGNGQGFESTRLLSHLRGVSRKTQIRLTPKVKHTICKRCDSLLIPGKSSHAEVVNLSTGGDKPWADVFEIRCHRCGAVKRFPMEPKIQKESKIKHQSNEKPRNSP